MFVALVLRIQPVSYWAWSPRIGVSSGVSTPDVSGRQRPHAAWVGVDLNERTLPLSEVLMTITATGIHFTLRQELLNRQDPHRPVMPVRVRSDEPPDLATNQKPLDL
jgi:hypothetical protein